MAYGGFTGYQDDPNTGLTSFQRADGPPISAFGPSAADLKAKIDAANQFAPVAVAQNASAPSPNMSDAVPAAPPPNQSVAPPPNASVAAPEFTPAPQPAPFDARRAAAELVGPPRPAPPPKQAVAISRDAKTGEIIYAEPGLNPGDPVHVFENQRAIPASPGGYQPKSMKISGANTAATPGDLEALREGSIDQKLAYQQAYDLHAESLAEQRAALDAQADANRIAIQEAQNRQAQMQAKADALQVQYDQAKQDFNSSKVDPMRSMRGMAGLGQALAMGLGAYGAAITKSPNFAANFVNQQIQADIAAQEAAIRIKGAAANTALGDLQRQFGSLDLAKAAYSGAVLQEQKRRLEVLANSAASREAAANYLQGAAQLDAAMQANDLAFRQAAAGKVETELSYRAPSAGRPGGQVPVTTETAEALHRIYPSLRPNQKGQDEQKTQERGLKLNAQVGHAAGFVLNPETDQWEEGPDSPGIGALIANKVGLETNQQKDVRAALKNYVPVKAHGLGERPPPLGQVEEAVHGYTEGRYTSTLLHALNQDRDAIKTGATVAEPAAGEEEPEGEK